LAAQAYDTADYFDSQIKELEQLPVKDDAVLYRLRTLKAAKALDLEMMKVMNSVPAAVKGNATPLVLHNQARPKPAPNQSSM